MVKPPGVGHIRLYERLAVAKGYTLRFIMSAPLPLNEQHRLDALKACNILDTAAEEDFDQIARLAAEICQCPVALVSLVDGKRQWYKARIGLETAETARDIAFCSHTIL